MARRAAAYRYFACDPRAGGGARVRSSRAPGVLSTVFFKLIAAPHFPTWTMLTISISFALALVLYEGAIVVLSD
jgi:hypothetical protein